MHGEVLAVTSEPTRAFNSQTQRLCLRYSPDATPSLTPHLILKRNIPEPWGVEAGADEVKFYQLCAALDRPPPAIVPCYAAEYDAASGDSYLLLHDLSPTHTHPVTREQQISITEGVPSAHMIEQVTTALAQHHAYWWNHPALFGEAFHIGYWSRTAERFALYVQRRRTAWERLLAEEVAWFPDDLRALYTYVFDHLERYWERYLAPRFQSRTRLTLIHGDAYFANFLCPVDPAGATYMLDWQSPTVDIGGYDLANLCAPFWNSAQRNEADRERRILQHYLTILHDAGVGDYEWSDLVADYQAGLIYWLLVPLQDRYDGSSKAYWWPKMQCLAAAFREWRCADKMTR
jgi:hypothetical protein